MGKLSLDQIMREYYQRQRVFEVLNSEGPVLSIVINEYYYFRFHQEKIDVASTKEEILLFLKGEKEISSPNGKRFSLSADGGWRNMMNDVESIIYELEK